MTNLEKVRQELVEAFVDLKFTEHNHKYDLNKQHLPSVSSQVKNFHKPFNVGIARFCAGKGKYQGMSEQEVIRSWERKRNESASFGTQTHKFGEEYVTGCIKPSNISELGITQWWMDKPPNWVVVATELPVYSSIMGYAGTPDKILYDTVDKEFIISDWKTNEDLFKNHNRNKLLPPFKKLMDTPYNKYQVQLSLYQMCLEEKGFPVKKRIIVWLKPGEALKFYQEYHTDDLTNELKNYYGNNS